MTVILDHLRFMSLARTGSKARLSHDSTQTLCLSQNLHLTVSTTQAEEFFKAHDAVKKILEKEDLCPEKI
ncbi:hypothetical protein FO488_00315 [Geobacter sp. FeAm09]|nr:hypothetical protein FO488_00315 [Geobacter sp. FeAm09]